MTNPSSIPRSLALNAFYGAHSRFAAHSQGDIRHLSRAARAVQPLRVPQPRSNVAAARSQSMSHEMGGVTRRFIHLSFRKERRDQVGVCMDL